MKKNIYNEFCKKSNFLIECIYKNDIHSLINSLIAEDSTERIKLFKFSVRKIKGKENFDKILHIIKSCKFSDEVIENFKFYFKLRISLEKEYFFAFDYLQKCDSLMLFTEVNRFLVDDKENYHDAMDFINLVFNYKKEELPKIKQIAYIASTIKKSKKELLVDIFKCYKKNKITNQLVQLFEYDFIDFSFNDKKNIFVLNNPRYDIKAITIAALDNEVVTQWQDIVLHSSEEKQLFALNNKEYLEQVEEKLMKTFPLNRFLFSDEQIQEIPIKYWLKAFSLIYKENWNCLKIEDNLLCTRRNSEWVRIFSEGGIDIEYQSKLLNILSFFGHQCGERDIQKYPFISIGDSIYTIPVIVCSSDIIRVLISVFEDLEKDLRFKGEYYESFVRDKWSKIGIKNIKKKEKTLGEEYDCDMAFVYNEDLFLCEIKNLLQPNSLHEWHRFYIKTKENVEQLERVVKHYSEPGYLKGIVKELYSRNEWIPRKIHSLLLYSCYLGTTFKSKEAWIASEIDVYNFFAKTPLCQLEVFENKKEAVYYMTYLNGYEYLENKYHRLTIDDFERYMQCPMAIKYQQNRVKSKKRNIKLAGVFLWIDHIDISKT